MSVWRVQIQTSGYATIEASTKKEAVEKARRAEFKGTWLRSPSALVSTVEKKS